MKHKKYLKFHHNPNLEITIKTDKSLFCTLYLTHTVYIYHNLIAQLNKLNSIPLHFVYRGSLLIKLNIYLLFSSLLDLSKRKQFIPALSHNI